MPRFNPDYEQFKAAMKTAYSADLPMGGPEEGMIRAILSGQASPDLYATGTYDAKGGAVSPLEAWAIEQYRKNMESGWGTWMPEETLKPGMMGYKPTSGSQAVPLSQTVVPIPERMADVPFQPTPEMFSGQMVNRDPASLFVSGNPKAGFQTQQDPWWYLATPKIARRVLGMQGVGGR